MNNNTIESEPVLHAFPCWKKGNGGAYGTYNVWRYDTPRTERILFAIHAESQEDACQKALKKIKEANTNEKA